MRAGVRGGVETAGMPCLGQGRPPWTGHLHGDRWEGACGKFEGGLREVGTCSHFPPVQLEAQDLGSVCEGLALSC